jgi:hypothetical protein
VLALQARARDHALEERLDRLERRLARLHAAIDGAIVTLPPDRVTTPSLRRPHEDRSQPRTHRPSP